MLPETYDLPNGFKIYIKNPVPKMQLSWHVPVTPEFRKEVNDWMAAFFGYHPDILDGNIIMDSVNKAIYMNEVQFAELRKQFAESPVYCRWLDRWDINTMSIQKTPPSLWGIPVA